MVEDYGASLLQDGEISLKERDSAGSNREENSLAFGLNAKQQTSGHQDSILPPLPLDSKILIQLN